ncbi:unnamed protein product [Rotaria sp. Silwood1]
MLNKEGDIHYVTERCDVRIQFYVFDENNQDLSSSIAQQIRWTVHPSALTKIHLFTFDDQVAIYRDEQQQCATDGDPVLHYACLGNQPNCVSLLLSKGADFNLNNSTVGAELIDLLLAVLNIVFNLKNERSFNVLHHAALKEYA